MQRMWLSIVNLWYEKGKKKMRGYETIHIYIEKGLIAKQVIVKIKK